MEWLPIEDFDNLPPKKRPENAVFLFRAENGFHAHTFLRPTIRTTRVYGARVATHLIPLPPQPKP